MAGVAANAGQATGQQVKSTPLHPAPGHRRRATRRCRPRATARLPVARTPAFLMTESDLQPDDTTIHATSAADCDKVIEGPVAAFAAASGAQLNPTKTKSLLFGSAARQPAHTSAATGITYTPQHTHVNHLGVIVGCGSDAIDARQHKINSRIGLIGKAVLQWSKPCAEAKRRWACSNWMLYLLQRRSLHLVLHLFLTLVKGWQRCQGAGLCAESRRFTRGATHPIRVITVALLLALYWQSCMLACLTKSL